MTAGAHAQAFGAVEAARREGVHVQREYDRRRAGKGDLAKAQWRLHQALAVIDGLGWPRPEVRRYSHRANASVDEIPADLPFLSLEAMR